MKLRVWPEGSWIQTQFKCEENGFVNRSAPHKTTWNFESTGKQIGLVSSIACGESRSNLCSKLKRSRHASSILRDFYSKPGIELRWSLVSVEFEKPKNLLYCSVNGYFCGNFTSNKEQCVALKISARFGFFFLLTVNLHQGGKNGIFAIHRRISRTWGLSFHPASFYRGNRLFQEISDANKWLESIAKARNLHFAKRTAWIRHSALYPDCGWKRWRNFERLWRLENGRNRWKVYASGLQTSYFNATTIRSVREFKTRNNRRTWGNRSFCGRNSNGGVPPPIQKSCFSVRTLLNSNQERTREKNFHRSVRKTGSFRAFSNG